uniref:Uncharacterized protein n=1 Tax=Glossina brevipalpis TaxID=37001 RepID=A0A1A9WQQ1_9MUSC
MSLCKQFSNLLLITNINAYYKPLPNSKCVNTTKRIRGRNFQQDLLKLLTILRAIIHNTAAVCLITIPVHLVAKYDLNVRLSVEIPKKRKQKTSSHEHFCGPFNWCTNTRCGHGVTTVVEYSILLLSFKSLAVQRHHTILDLPNRLQN